MAKQIQLRRGTTAENKAFTGANGELTYDTEKKQLRVHDGSTVGGKVVDDTTRDVTGQVEQATETVAGKAKIATQAEANTGTNDATIITPKKLKEVSFGRIGSYVDVTASRLKDTVYTNPKNTPLVVAITAGAQASGTSNKTSIICGDLETVYVNSSAGSFTSTQTVIVPPLAQYKLNNPLSIVKWMEW